MNLPHKAPLIFAKEVLEKNEHTVKVNCVFPEVPTLAMFIEAAAQSSAGFYEGGSLKMGFLTLANEVKCLETFTQYAYVVKVRKEGEVGHYLKFSFEAFEQSTQRLQVEGDFTLILS